MGKTEKEVMPAQLTYPNVAWRQLSRRHQLSAERRRRLHAADAPGPRHHGEGETLPVARPAGIDRTLFRSWRGDMAALSLIIGPAGAFDPTHLHLAEAIVTGAGLDLAPVDV
jgi:hypothetical protein